MSNEKYNSQEDVRKYHQLMGEICLKRARDPEQYFFMNVQDPKRRMKFVRTAIPNARELLKEYGIDPVIAVSGYYIHQAIAHFELIRDMNNYGRANNARTARNIAYNDEMIKSHVKTIRNVSPEFARKMLDSFKGLEGRL